MTVTKTLQGPRIRPGPEYGFLGARLVGVLGPGKKRLLRRPHWPDPKGARLTIVKSPARLGLRPVLARSYPQESSSGRFLEQDLTGLVSLDRAVLIALREGKPGQVVGLLRAAGAALETLGHSPDEQGQVALRHPASLAVTAQGQIVALDAELRALGPWPAEAARDFARWLGTQKQTVPAHDASRRQARALVLYVRELLRRLKGEAAPPARPPLPIWWAGWGVSQAI